MYPLKNLGKNNVTLSFWAKRRILRQRLSLDSSFSKKRWTQN